MKAMKRRRFIRLLSAGMATASLPVVSSCQSFQPRPFVTGRTITPPQGCTELLRRDPRGDC